MQVKRLVLVLLGMMLVHTVVAKTMEIGLFWNQKITSTQLSVSATYYLRTNTGVIIEIPTSELLTFTYKNSAIEVRSRNRNYGSFSSLSVETKNNDNYFKIKRIKPLLKEKSYNGNLAVSTTSNGLKFINKIDIEKYIEGVSESEAGKGRELEYYKVQAVISRTFALRHVRKHEADGFELCDQVHCQAYNSRLRYTPLIAVAVKTTKGKVIVDSDINLISATFYSNCGGQTNNSEDVWIRPLPYLRSVIDTFCTSSTNATWQKELSKEKWENYLVNSHEFACCDSTKCSVLEEFNQYDRMRDLECNGVLVPLTTLRTDWKMKSTFFSYKTEGNILVLKGRGFGHGVGMCQEGAMRMAELGYNYTSILHFYYTSVHLIDLKYLDFFREQ